MNVETALQSCFPCAYLSSKAPLHLCKSKLIQFNNYLILEFLMGFWGFGVIGLAMEVFESCFDAAVAILEHGVEEALLQWFVLLLEPDHVVDGGAPVGQ